MGRSDEECRRYERLEMDQAGGGVPTEQERAFLAEHLARCETCRTAASASALMRHTDDAGPARPLDELSRRRFVNFVVTQAAADGPMEEEPSLTAADPSGLPRWQWMSAAAVLLALGVGLVLVLRWSGADRDRSARSRPRAHLVMRSGEVLVEGARAPSDLAVGKTLWVRRGRAAVALPDDAYVLLGERSAARVVRVSPGETTVHLEQGWLLASVQPRRNRRRFVVTTRAGRVEVIGTVFTVRVTAEEVTVEVLRGQVRLVEPGHAQRLVQRGHAAQLGGVDRKVRPLAAGARRAALARMASLALLGDGQGAQLDVRSEPAGAEVALDGVVLGRTPLSARLRAGHLRLQVSLAGRTPVREQLTLRAGDRIHRDYDLGQGAVSVRPLSPSRAGAGVAAVAPTRPLDPAVEVFPPVVIHRPARRLNGATKARINAPSTVTARDLLLRAQKRRAARDWRGAAASYRLLLAKFPTSSAARAARVALGMLSLDHLGDPAGALRIFDAYLRATRRGVLAQEAAYGYIRALRRLGRRKAEKRALRTFLKYYPAAIQAPLVKRRLEDLAAPAKKRP